MKDLTETEVQGYVCVSVCVFTGAVQKRTDKKRQKERAKRRGKEIKNCLSPKLCVINVKLLSLSPPLLLAPLSPRLLPHLTTQAEHPPTPTPTHKRTTRSWPSLSAFSRRYFELLRLTHSSQKCFLSPVKVSVTNSPRLSWQKELPLAITLPGSSFPASITTSALN